MSKLPPATIITSTAELERHVDIWAGEALLALDTESNSLHAYQEQVCLIQLSTRKTDYIIDPLLVEDLSPLNRLLSDPAIETVFHAAEYDIMCLKRDFGFNFASLFDTMLAARTCGSNELGYGTMLDTHFGVKANKKYQRANWGMRPLTADMLQYAQLDTHYLPALRDYWKQQLVEMGRWDEVSEVFRDLTQIPAASYTFDEEGFWHINGAHRLEPQQLAVLRELYLFRDRAAQKRDYPSFKIMGDKTLLELAKTMPANLEQLGEVRGMTPGQVRRYGHSTLRAIARGTNEPPPVRPPSPPRPSDEVVARYEALRTWRKERASQRGVESDVIVSRDALWALAHRAPTSHDELTRIRQLGPWKVQTYGNEILNVLSGVNSGSRIRTN